MSYSSIRPGYPRISRIFAFAHFAEALDRRAPDIIAVQELFASPFVPFFCAQSFAVRVMASLGYNAVIGPNPTILDLVRRGKWILACFQELFPVVRDVCVRPRSTA